ncbi:MAG: PhzF family phenazine biosynthesis protein [Bacteroidales bacterium]|nr:PhzF family phenazine biosynthesis protein [Bacteroidales bacterium]
MRFYIVDAFTDKAFGGNTAGVVLIENGESFPDEIFMQNLAAELRYSETAFITQNNESEFTTRYFTPEGEVDLCGHATISAFHVLEKENFIEKGKTYLNHTKAGNLKIILNESVFMQMAQVKDLGTLEEKAELADLYAIMGIDYKKKDFPFLPKIISTGLPDILLPLRGREELNLMKPDMNALSSLSGKMNVVGVHAFALDSSGKYSAFVRNFAPLYGINEEAATGTSNGALTYWLYCNGLISEETECLFLQGETMKRPSEIRTRLDIKENCCNIWVGGKCKILACGNLILD